ncbi:receptor-type tyrosine-protein phosphatase C-like [Protopterus annectens]|uniref:receptor-type tyrosine-protein phosphatase C-like n=1 Tax=Protopterus annectens TaxID=7888 RepID=UPI001CFBE6BD|nr:receptor-type tyrosine-protein phosphatase C-like [Protopterus annectens]
MNTLLVIFLVLYAGVLPGSTNEAQQTTASTTMTASTMSAVTTVTSSKPTSTDTSSSPNGTTDSMQSQTASTSDKSVSGTANTNASSVSVTAVATTGNTTTSTTHASTSQGVSSIAHTNDSSVSVTAVATTGNTTTSTTHASTSQGVSSIAHTNDSSVSVTAVATTGNTTTSTTHASTSQGVSSIAHTNSSSMSITAVATTGNTTTSTTHASTSQGVSSIAHTNDSSVSVTAVATTGNTTTSTTHASTSQGVSNIAHTNVSSVFVTAVATTGNTTTSTTHASTSQGVSSTALTNVSSMSITAVATTGNTTTSTTHASTSQGVSSMSVTAVATTGNTTTSTTHASTSQGTSHTSDTQTSNTHASPQTSTKETSRSTSDETLGVISTSDTHASIMSVTSLTTTNDSSPSAPHATDNTSILHASTTHMPAPSSTPNITQPSSTSLAITTKDNTSVTHASTTPMPASASIPDITQTSNTSLATTEASPCGNYTITQEENYLMISLDPPSNVSVRYNYNGKSDTTLIVDKGRINEFEPCTAVEITEVSRNSCTFYGQRTITTNFTNFTFTDVDVTEGNTTLTFGWNTTVEPQKCKIVYTINCTNGTHYSLKNITKKENTLDGLNPYTNYTCIWNAFFENVSIKTEKKNTMTDVGKPDKPWAIVAIPGQQNMSLTWNSPNKTHGPIHGYTVCWQGEHSCQKNCKNSNTTKISTGDCLSPYTDYNVSVAAYNVMKNQIQLTGISETLLKRTKSAKPDAVEIQDIIYKTKNEVHVPCKGGKKNGPNQFFILLEESNLIQKMNATNCSFHLRDLDYLTTYRIQIYANNGEHDGIKAIKTFSTGYNDKALIGFLAFLIIVTSIALLIVLYKIYLLQRKASGSSDESLELIDRDDEKQLMNIDPISCERLLEAYRNKIADEGRLFLAEFQSIPRIFSKYSAKEARKPYNQTKNRYVDILPYDINRVQLTQVSGEPGSDYINASHIDGFKEPRKYIAAQGPKDETVDDFWKMIWEQQSTIIVMVTRCEEGNRNKCAEYWPTLEKGTKTFGDILVTISEEKRCPDYIIRKLHVTNVSLLICLNEISIDLTGEQMAVKKPPDSISQNFLC